MLRSVPFPLAVLVLLCRTRAQTLRSLQTLSAHRRMSAITPASLRAARPTVPLGILFEAFAPRAYWWQVVTLSFTHADKPTYC